MDCYLINIQIWNFGIKTTDGATIFAYFGEGGKLQID